MSEKDMLGKISALLDLKAQEFEIIKYLLHDYGVFLSKYKTICLWGAGRDGRVAAEYLSDHLKGKDTFFVDNDHAKHGQEICEGLYCYGRDKLIDCDPDETVILVTTTLYAEEVYQDIIYWQNNEMFSGEPNKKKAIYVDKSFSHWLLMYQNSLEYFSHKQDILDTLSLLDDLGSYQVLYRCLFSRLSTFRDMSDMVILPEYFPPEINERLEEDEVFLDCGGYIGDTIEDFRRQTNDCFKAIYSFEMDENNLKRMLENPAVQDERIQVFHYGVSDQNRRERFFSQGVKSSYDIDKWQDEWTGYAELRTVDSLIESAVIPDDITFIKMDIEGAEMDALKGMQNVIRRKKPKLAVCIYHKPEDIWQIPAYIHHLVPEYKLMVRHHHALGIWGTVLYAYME